MSQHTTDFGFREVPVVDKQRLVGEVFSSVATRYDLMNDVMSMGLHRLWKRFAVAHTALRPGDHVLDVAGGTGDLSARLASAVGSAGHVICADINGSMLRVGRDQLLDRGIGSNVEFVQANAESLPFASNRFDAVTIAFGLRNVTDKQRALESMRSVLKPGGRLVVLEFSQVVLPWLKQVYDRYSFNVLPRLGQIVAGDRDSYQYLVESIRKHPPQHELANMMTQAGLERVDWCNLSGGIVAVHRGYRM
ncbi:MAG: bifunctional demethylmenaquinone methyltransferase/2-methoxy-6-polyprenyl-1,4-benzoquinol methylase UbiE [Gammaproteobacteria bacterium]